MSWRCARLGFFGRRLVGYPTPILGNRSKKFGRELVKIDTARTSVEHQRELETKVRELIGRSNIGLGGGY